MCLTCVCVCMCVCVNAYMRNKTSFIHSFHAFIHLCLLIIIYLFIDRFVSAHDPASSALGKTVVNDHPLPGGRCFAIWNSVPWPVCGPMRFGILFLGRCVVPRCFSLSVNPWRALRPPWAADSLCLGPVAVCLWRSLKAALGAFVPRQPEHWLPFIVLPQEQTREALLSRQEAPTS